MKITNMNAYVWKSNNLVFTANQLSSCLRSQLRFFRREKRLQSWLYRIVRIFLFGDIEIKEAIVRVRYMLMAKNVLLASIPGHEQRTPHSTDLLSLFLNSLFADDFLSPSSLPLLCPGVGEDKTSVKTTHVPSSPFCLLGEVWNIFNPDPSHYIQKCWKGEVLL